MYKIPIMNTEFKNKIDQLVAEYESNVDSIEEADLHKWGELKNKEQHQLLEKITAETNKALTPTNYDELNAIAKEAIAHIRFSVVV